MFTQTGYLNKNKIKSKNDLKKKKIDGKKSCKLRNEMPNYWSFEKDKTKTYTKIANMLGVSEE